ncbi:glutamate decarboxylase B, PLP-dependent [Legionella sainthelensi]|uniref:glutamate decarboxylase n=1 Tax=Legionella sainthelensi TaxID=28087 RepID=UPI000E205D67|nr:glutamate decarboxylase [Legionella sainthelensi]VEB38406.1 glutamate decarboxylase B, PLP-dependent [Legionella sainthelensi]
MIVKKDQKKSKASTHSTSVYASRYDLDDFSVATCNEYGMSPAVAKQLIEDELCLEATPILNLASFVTTWMEPEAEELIKQSINKNFINYEEYPRVQEIHQRCVHILADLLNIPEGCDYVGTATVGSSEAIMLAGLAHKFSWRNKRKMQGLESSKPNIVMGANVQVCWDKFARYFDVEARIIPLKKNKFTISAEDVASLIDEHTICIAAVLGSTFTGEYDEIEEINDLLIQVKKEKGWDIPLHVDGASGGFISMFYDNAIKWDFRLEQVKSINLSGHKYGLVYPSVGWLLFREEAVVPKDLIFEVNYLGGQMPTYTLNFSRSSSMVIAQYYNFLRLGKKGYKKIISNMLAVSDIVVQGLTATGKFDLLGDRRMAPVVTVALKDNTNYSVFDVSKKLREYGWIVPAYTLPEAADEVEALRVVIKENMSSMMARHFIASVEDVLKELEESKGKSEKYQGKSLGMH